MNIRGNCLIGVAALGCAAGALATEPVLDERPEAAAVATLGAEIVVGMRELLRAVTPEIALPSIELRLPTVGAK
jgi:hypothetical protein